MRIVVVALVIAALSRPVGADAPPARVAAIKAMVAAQAKAFLKRDEDAFKATLTFDADVSMGLDPLRDGVELWNEYIVKKAAVTQTAVGWSGTWGWVVAEVQISSVLTAAAIEANAKPEPSTQRWIEFVVADGDGVKTRVMRAMETDSDEWGGRDYVQKLAVMASPSPAVAILAAPVTIAKQLSSDPATTVIGSDAKERGFGAAAAKKLVASWSKVTLELVESADPREFLYTPFELAVGDATVVWAKVRIAIPGKARKRLLEALAITRKTATGSEILVVAYGPGS